MKNRTVGFGLCYFVEMFDDAKLWEDLNVTIELLKESLTKRITPWKRQINPTNISHLEELAKARNRKSSGAFNFVFNVGRWRYSYWYKENSSSSSSLAGFIFVFISSVVTICFVISSTTIYSNLPICGSWKISRAGGRLPSVGLGPASARPTVGFGLSRLLTVRTPDLHTKVGQMNTKFTTAYCKLNSMYLSQNCYNCIIWLPRCVFSLMCTIMKQAYIIRHNPKQHKSLI